MTLRSVNSILILTIFILIATFGTACDKKSESLENDPIEKAKSLETIENFKAIGNQKEPKKVSDIVDEVINSLPEIVASVNDVKITSRPIKQALKRYKNLLTHQKKVIDKNEIKKVLNSFLDVEIQREVAFQHGKTLNIKVPNDEIEKVLEQFKNRHGSKEKFLKEFSNLGTTVEMFKKEIYRNVLVSKLIEQEVYDKIKISKQQALDFYDKNENYFKNPEMVHAAHILTKVSPEMKDEDKKAAKKKIEDALKKARAGEDFAELAKKYSEGPSAPRGGDLKYIVRGQMVQKFEDALFKLKVGEISSIVETQFGYHIIKAIDKKEAKGKRPFDEVKAMIFDFLKKSEAEKKTKAYLNNILKKANIKRNI